MGSTRDRIEMSPEVQHAEANKGLWRLLQDFFIDHNRPLKHLKVVIRY